MHYSHHNSLRRMPGDWKGARVYPQHREKALKVLHSRVFSGCFQDIFQQFARVTSIGSLPTQNLGKSRGPPQNPAEPCRTLGEAPAELWETPAEPSERQISSESLAEGCAPRMVTLWNFRIFSGSSRLFSGHFEISLCLFWVCLAPFPEDVVFQVVKLQFQVP